MRLLNQPLIMQNRIETAYISELNLIWSEFHFNIWRAHQIVSSNLRFFVMKFFLLFFKELQSNYLMNTSIISPKFVFIVSFIPYFCFLVSGILFTLIAWFSFRSFLSCPSCLAKCKKEYVIFSYFRNFVAKSDQKPKTKTGMNKTLIQYYLLGRDQF